MGCWGGGGDCGEGGKMGGPWGFWAGGLGCWSREDGRGRATRGMDSVPRRGCDELLFTSCDQRRWPGGLGPQDFTG